VGRLLVTANVVPSTPILFTLMMEELGSSETSVLTRATWRNMREDGISLIWFRNSRAEVGGNSDVRDVGERKRVL
jgi:hypothetical protein